MWISRKKLEQIEREKARLQKECDRLATTNFKKESANLDLIHRIEAYEQIFGQILLQHKIDKISIPLTDVANKKKLNVEVTENFNEATREIEIQWRLNPYAKEGKSNIKSR